MTVQPLSQSRPQGPVPRSGTFARLWAAYTVTVAGNEFYALAVPLIVYHTGGTASAMSTVYACTMFPQIAMGILGGVLADRSDRVRMLRLCYMTSAAALLLAFAVFSATDVSIEGLATVAVLLGITAPVASATFDSALPQFVASERLPRANAATEASRTACVVLGPAAAGFTVGRLAPEYVLLINSLCFALSCVLLYRMASPLKPAPSTGQGFSQHWQDLKTGLKYVFTGEISIRIGIFLSTVVNFVFGAYEPMIVYRMKSDLGLSSDAVGLAFAVSGVASVAVALGLSWKAPSRSFLPVMGLSVVLQGVAVGSVALLPSVPSVVAAQVAFAIGTLVYTVYWRAMRQTVVPGELLGRVAGTCRSVAYGGAFLGSVTSALVLNTFVGVDTALLTAGLAATFMGVGVFAYGWRTSTRGKAAA